MMGGKLISYLLVLDYLFPPCQVSEKACNSPDCCAKWPLPFPCSFYFSVSLALWLTLNRMLSHTYCQWSLDDLRSLVLLFPLLSHPQSIQYYSAFSSRGWRGSCLKEWVPTHVVSFQEVACCYVQQLSSLLCGCGRLPKHRALGCENLCPASGGWRFSSSWR